MKTLALSIALSFFSFWPLSFAAAHDMDMGIHENFEWNEETLQSGEQELAECYQCVFPLEWLESLGEDALKSMVIDDADTLIHKTSFGDFGASATGKMTYPVSGGATFLSGLGARRSGGRRHQGVDLGARTGTPVVAVWPGKVIKSGRSGLGGWSAKILHPNGLSTYYAHFNGPAQVRDGQLVRAGEQLGSVGHSGNADASSPHLHFEVRRGGAVLNPLSYISR